jgi:two-component system sensor histidine kinase LytS
LAYLEIIKVRFSEQFAVRCDIGEGVEDALIPPGTLQPLVENCIQHGLKDRPTGGEIVLTVKKVGNFVCFHMEDNGSGVSPDLLPILGRVPTESKEGNGIGVHNVNQRLVSLRGPDAQLIFRNKPEGGCLVTFSIPIQKEESA